MPPKDKALAGAGDPPPNAQADDESGKIGTGPTGPGDSGDADEKVSVRWVILTTGICVSVAALGHLLILVGYLWHRGEDPLIPWQFCVGITVALIAVVAFGGFYAATLRARVAIASSVILTFLVLLSFDLSIAELFGRPGAAPSLLTGDLRHYVGTVIAFYFGSEALISGTKAIGVAFGKPDTASQVMTVDRDAAKRPEGAAGELSGLLWPKPTK